MKLFVTMFAAIMAAAIVIFSGLYAVGRINKWERELSFCYAQGESLNAEGRVSQSSAEMSSDLDTLSKVRLARLKLVEANERLERAREIGRRIVAILERKPFGLPLTSQERKVLDTFKASIAKAEQQNP